MGQLVEIGRGNGNPGPSSHQSEQFGETAGVKGHFRVDARLREKRRQHLGTTGEVFFVEGEKTLFAQFGKIDRLAVGQAMIIRENDCHLGLSNRRDLEITPDLRPRLPKQSQVDLSFAKRLLLLARSHLENLHAGGPVLPVEASHPFGQESRQGRGKESHPHRLLHIPAGEGLHRFGHRGREAQHLAGVGQGGLAGLRQPQPTRSSIEERDPEFLLQVFDLAGDRRLRNIQTRGRSADVQFLGRHDEIPEVTQFHLV